MKLEGTEKTFIGQERDRWEAVVTVVMNFRFPNMQGNFWAAKDLLRFSKRSIREDSLQGCYAMSTNKYLPKFWSSLFFRNVGNQVLV
jgi:hypothetical protein